MPEYAKWKNVRTIFTICSAFLAMRTSGTGLYRTPETFLSCIHCRFSLVTLFPASLAPDFFASSRDNNTTEKFRGRFDRHNSQVLAPRGLISINCGMTPPSPSTMATRSVLQGGNSARRTGIRATVFSRDNVTSVLYTAEEQRVNVTGTCTSTCDEDRDGVSNGVIFEKNNRQWYYRLKISLLHLTFFPIDSLTYLIFTEDVIVS